ncbi:Methyltransferase domain-containing protein [Jatrophihabitans endophyticus]|uniref:Methyltransferase domain-containing protein n=1 Tax=Jatrophihabitans endophyticus TaxID=1206085 RepID=A0A1M5ICP3_9ACTN|nr:class I SAM-dependent methyltransferase [Jatrophihabitans endophyticus]SHG26076.1 Methyltransferase domain-containing protein [Jatrophihabitans endophyticus]
MTEERPPIDIPQLVETRATTPDYSGITFTDEQLEAGAHRRFVGGRFDSHGEAQLEFLRGRGLQPHHRFLDVGCGSLRAGRHLVDYLDPAHYWGIDANADLVRAGYVRELDDAQRAKLPLANLRVNDRFNADFGVGFDVAIAQSIFSHVSLNHVRLCLYRVAQVMNPGGRCYVTFYEQPAGTRPDRIVAQQGRKPQLTERNVFWYYRSDLRWAAAFAPWRFRYLGDWGHPGGQMMIELTRVGRARAAGTGAAATLLARARRRAARAIAP